MEKTQRIADEKHAYTLTDRGTWLATKDKDRLAMMIVLEGDPTLFNQYGVMAVNPAKYPASKIQRGNGVYQLVDIQRGTAGDSLI